MRKLITVGTIGLAGLVLAACDGKPNPTAWELEKPDHNYEVDTWGFNSEVYEITPKSNPDYACVMWMLDNNRAMGLQCFPKAESE